jgi:hypothetical protein
MSSAPEAAPYIIDTGENFVSMGGFQGRDPVFTESDLLEMVKKGELVYAMTMPRGGRGPGGPGNATLSRFIEQYGEPIEPGEWYLPDRNPEPPPPDTPPFMADLFRQPPTLYRLKPQPRPKKDGEQPPKPRDSEA